MAGTLSWIALVAAAFFFGMAATIKLLTGVVIRNSEYDGGEGCVGNFISTIAALIGVCLVYLSISGF